MEQIPWYRLKEEDLLNRSIRSLGLSLENTEVEILIERLYAELEAKGLIFEPSCFLGEEWFCPVGIPAIGIPFYLAHPRLRKLEQKMMMEVEGGDKEEFMKLIRHEAGHAYSYAFHLYKRKKWRTLFGSASEEYPDTYRVKPYSKAHVIHLDHWYAQSHPDEDFAETFSVWLTPGMNWKKRYRGWKALEKLEYVDELMTQLKGKPAKHQPEFQVTEHDGLGIKLKTYFRRKRKLYQESFPDFYDKDLKTLFTEIPEERGPSRASVYLKASSPELIKAVQFATKEKKYTIDQLIQSFIERTKELNLYVRKEDYGLDFRIASYFTNLITTYLHTGKFKYDK